MQLPFEEIHLIAKQYSRREDETQDLVQDLFLEAIRTGRDLTEVSFMPRARGFLRNRAAFIARTEGRRRKREDAFHSADDSADRAPIMLPENFISGLRPSLRIIARLVNCGLNRKEILYLLQIADAALRQRLTALRRKWNLYMESGAKGTLHAEEAACLLQTGLIRRTLCQVSKNSIDRKGNVADIILGFHDPDGHLFAIRSIPAHKKDGAGNNSGDRGDKLS